MAEVPKFPACANFAGVVRYQVRGGVWFPGILPGPVATAAEQAGCEPVQHFLNGSAPAGVQKSPEGIKGLNLLECKLLGTRYPDAIKFDPSTRMLTLPFVPKGTVLQLKPEPGQANAKLDRLFDALWEEDAASGKAAFAAARSAVDKALNEAFPLPEASAIAGTTP